MNPIAVTLAISVFLMSCATGHHYYDRDQDGTRYYETKNGKKIHVTTDGMVYGEGGQKLGEAMKRAKDWDVSAYEVQPSYSRCVDLFAWEESVPCWEYGVQIPVFFIGITVGAAVVGAYLVAGMIASSYISDGVSQQKAAPGSLLYEGARGGGIRDRDAR